jgi:hypothetical protein
MGDTERPVEGRPDQIEQARLITRTGNGPTVDDEQQLLADRFGTPDMAGAYQGSDAPAEDDDQVDEQPADEQPDPAPADEKPSGGAKS